MASLDSQGNGRTGHQTHLTAEERHPAMVPHPNPSRAQTSDALRSHRSRSQCHPEHCRGGSLPAKNVLTCSPKLFLASPPPLVPLPVEGYRGPCGTFLGSVAGMSTTVHLQSLKWKDPVLFSPEATGPSKYLVGHARSKDGWTNGRWVDGWMDGDCV